MAYIQPGSTLTLTAPRAVVVGDGALVGSIFGVSLGIYANGASGEFSTQGVHEIAKTSAQAWTEGARVYWDNTNFRADTDSTVGQLIGVASEAAANPSSVGRVKLLGNAPATAEGPQAAIADLTDNSGGAAADGTIALVTAPTALTDNGGGTADGTVASQAAPVTLTDSTGLSGAHDDTLADGQVTTGTLVTAAADGAFEVIGATNAGDVSGAISNNFGEVQAALVKLTQNDSDLAQKAIELVTLAGVAQNNLKELTTAQAEDRAAIVALTDAIKEVSTKLNATLSALRAAGIIAP